MWSHSNGYAISTFEFSDFFRAVVFIEKISLLCDKLQHQPLWQKSLHKVRVEIAVDKVARKLSAPELQLQIDDIYKSI
jgi:pterin-4a-carbinolamine dehydratase